MKFLLILLFFLNSTSKITKYAFNNQKTVSSVLLKSICINYNYIIRHLKTKKIVRSTFNQHYIDEKSKMSIPLNGIQEYISTDIVNIIYFKPKNDSLWIGTTKELFLMNEKEQVINWINKKKGLLNENIQNIYIEDDNTFGFAPTESGLIKWDGKNNRFVSFIENIYNDNFRFLWLSTGVGLNKYAPKTGSRNNKIFMLSQGISHKELNVYSHFQDERGLNGLTTLNSFDLLEKKNTSASDIVENNKRIDKKHELLQDNIIIIKEKNHLTFLDFLNKKPIQYKIDGIHDDYVLSKNNIIVLPNIPEGKYKLHIKRRNVDGVWSSLDKPIEIIIKKSFSKIDVFLFLLTSVILLFLFILFKYNKPANNKKLTTTINDKQIPLKINEYKETHKIINKMSKQWLEKFEATIIENLSSVNFSVEFLSHELELSERQLQRRVKKLTGTTPNKHITEIRLLEALRIIENQEITSVKSLSQKVGFSTTEYFSRLFKERFGKNPSDLIRF